VRFQLKTKNVVALIIFTYIFVLMYKSTKRVDLSKEKMQIVKGEELPIQVLDALRISNNPSNTNPWGKNFLEKSSFQWICEDNCNYEYELDIDEGSGGFFGRDPTILHLNGFEIILYRNFKEGKSPYILFDNDLYFIVTVNYNYSNDIIHADFGKIDFKKYLN